MNVKKWKLCLAQLLVWCVAPLLVAPALAQTLKVTFGAKGVQTIAYGATILEDTNAFPGDTFHIWHTRLTDLNGNLLDGSQGQYGWGETNNSEAWDASTKTETYFFIWGSIATPICKES